MTTTTPPPLPSNVSDARSLFDFGRCFSDAMEVYRRNVFILVAAWILTDILSLVTLLILIGPLTGGWVILGMRAMGREDRRVDVGDLFRAFHRFGGLLLLFVVCSLPIMIGYLLLVLPGLLLGTIWMFTFPLLVDQRMGVFQTFGASARIVRRHGFWRLVGLSALLFALTLPTAIPYLGMVLAWFILPFVTLVWVAAYRQCMDGYVCLVCGYDLRATIDTDRLVCPECGCALPVLGAGCDAA